MAYLTKSNSIKIISNIDFKQIGDLKGEVYIKPIYFFSTYEKNSILGLVELLKDPINFVREFYKPITIKDNLRFVFEGGQPAYHANPTCPRLNSSYKNFEIPNDIREKGKEEVVKFRNWFKENQYLLEKTDVFVARLHAAFGIMINPQSIDYDNSGVEIKENLNLQELEEKINYYLREASNYYNNSDKEKQNIIKRFSKHTFLAKSDIPLRDNDTRFSDDKIKEFLKQYDMHFKRPVKDLLIEYHRVKLNPELKFEGQLLVQLGFRPCAECHNNVNDIFDKESPQTIN